jgi:soluble lytic murein transglycosylase
VLPKLDIRADAKALALALALAACTPRDGSTPVHGTPDASATSDASSTAAIVEAGERGVGELATALPWTEAIREELWTEAEAGIAKLPAGEQRKPDVRYARARVAMARGEPAEAVKLLDKLEDDLPLMRDLVAKARAKAALEAGPYDRAAEWYASRPQPSAWLIAADAWKKAGDTDHMRAMCDRVIRTEKRTRSQEEHARTMRLELLRDRPTDATVIQDARWLATFALDDKTHDAALALVPKPNPLEAAEWIARSRTLADAGRIEEALRAAERASTAKGGHASPVEVCHARAEAFWKARTRYPEAALQYRQCASYGGVHAAEDSFLSARAFERAERDGDAVPAYEKIARRWPKTSWADEAEFHVARSHALAGRWKDASSAFDEYLRHFQNGKERREAERYRAIAYLMAQDHKTARKHLEVLSGSADDSLTAARFANLAALAALRDGERTHAVALWSDVARTRPLSWPALVARARLASVSAPLPLTIDPAESGDPPPPLEVELPPPVDMLHRIGLDDDAEEALRDRENLVVAKSGGRGTEALCKAYSELDRGKRRYQISLQIPGQLLATAPGPKNRWAWECAFPRPHRTYVQKESDKAPSDLVWAVMRQESAFDPAVVSPARAVGLLQLMPETARKVAAATGAKFEDAMLTSPQTNIALGAAYLKELTTELASNVPLVVGAYNAGVEAITRWEARAKGQETLDVFVETIPFLETRGYVVRVMGNLARYGYMERGEAGVPQIALDLK